MVLNILLFKGACASIFLKKETELCIHTDNVDNVEIEIFKLRIGFVIVSEDKVLQNENGIYQGVKENFLTFKEKFPLIQSVE